MPHPTTPPSLYLNLHAADPEASEKFLKGMGMTPITEYSDVKTKTFRLPGANSNVAVMVHAHERFLEFVRPGTKILDAHVTTESLISIAVEDETAVDEWLGKAVALGGTADPFIMKDYGAECGMYSRSFADVDGHIWELCTMLGNKDKDEKSEAEKETA